jgi:hypothetical protein
VDSAPCARDALFAAIAAADTGAIGAAVAPDYVLIEDGAIWNVDSLNQAVLGLRRDGLEIEYGSPRTRCRWRARP